jgi:hypothetical protein
MDLVKKKSNFGLGEIRFQIGPKLLGWREKRKILISRKYRCQKPMAL